jgi:hypothetical protein
MAHRVPGRAMLMVVTLVTLGATTEPLLITFCTVAMTARAQLHLVAETNAASGQAAEKPICRLSQ